MKWKEQKENEIIVIKWNYRYWKNVKWKEQKESEMMGTEKSEMTRTERKWNDSWQDDKYFPASDEW